MNSSSATLVAPRVVCVTDFKFTKVLGRGAFGTVFSVQDKKSGMKLALKVLKKKGLDERATKAIIEEQKTLRTTGTSEWLLSIVASWHDSRFYYLAMVPALTFPYPHLF